MTSKEKRFWQVWLEHWPRPQHSSAAAIQEGVSPYLLFRDWLNNERTSMEQVEASMRLFAREKYGPKYSQIREVYDRRTGRRGQSPELHGPKCEACSGTGYITVPTVRRGRHIVPIRSRAEILTGELLYSTPVPCKCSAGQRENAANDMGYSQEALDALFACRVTPSQFGALSGVREPERDEWTPQLAKLVTEITARVQAGNVSEPEHEWSRAAQRAELVAAGVNDDDEF